LSLQRILVVLIETLNIVTVKALVADLQPDSERVHRRKFFDRETNGFGSTWETSIYERWREPPLRFAMNSSAGVV